jgi:putative ABC transport system permease protein
MKFLLLILKNVRRHPLRAVLTSLGTMVLVCVVTSVWTVLAFFDSFTAEQKKELKAIVTDRWRIPSQMPLSYARTLAEGAARRPGDVRPLDFMTWQFYVGTLDQGTATRENSVFAVAVDPRKIRTMMDELDKLPADQAARLDAAVAKMLANRRGIILGKDRLAALNKRVGERFAVYGQMYRGIDLEFEIVGVFPPGRWDAFAVMNADYLNEAIDAYGRTSGSAHPLADKRLNLVWLRLANEDAFNRVSAQIAASPYYTNPAVKCETLSSLVTASMTALRDIIWAFRWLLVPAALASLSLLIANAISISVRERRVELAVLKVLGFRSHHILLLVLGEAVLIGSLAGFASAGLTYLLVNHVLGGIKFPVGLINSMYVPGDAVWWGVAIGTGTALLGSIVPAWTARNVKVAEVFSKVA